MKIRTILYGMMGMALFLTACKPPVAPKRIPPDNLIGEEQIVEMMCEQMIMESAFFLQDDKSSKRTVAEETYSHWFYQHGVTPEQFQASVEYYLKDEADTERILNAVKNRLTEKRNSLSKMKSEAEE